MEPRVEASNPRRTTHLRNSSWRTAHESAAAWDRCADVVHFFAGADEDLPCEDLLTKLQDALKAAQLSDSDKAKVEELQNKGIERCSADDDEHADQFFTEALEIQGQ